MNHSQHFSSLRTSQSEQIPGSNQVANSAGGFVWAVDDWTRLDRFLVLGSEGGSYYASEKTLTIECAQASLRCVQADGERAVKRVVEISEAGRAPKNDPALFVLAIAAGMGNDKTRQAALAALPRVARIGTHLFTFAKDVQEFRGWGRGLKRAIGAWYTDKPADQIAYQAVKYQQRNGYSHRDLLRQAHPVGPTLEHKALFQWIVKKEVGANVPVLVQAYTEAQQAKEVGEIVRLIGQYPKLTWEMIPTELLGDAKVWEALLPNLPMTALIRNLARMTANGLLVPMSQAASVVAERLSDEDRLRKERVHPLAILGALTTYQSGHGAKGSLSWDPVPQVVDALDKAFYLSFGNVESTGKRIQLALDVSGSMTCSEIAGMPGLTPRTASAALALITANVEKRHSFVGFSHSLVPLNISPRQRLDDVIRTIDEVPYSTTNCALPMLEALRNRVEVDTFVVYTDSETYEGDIHASQALEQYRREMGIPAKLVVVGMVANEFTIADPNDAGMLDVVGFDTATPSLISDFARQ